MKIEIGRTAAVINLAAIRENVKNAQLRAGGKGIIAIIKADGYGHGSVQVGRAIEDLVHGFGVAIVEEGVTLRKAGIKKPILILGNPHPSVLEDIFTYGLTPSVSTLSIALKLNNIAFEKRVRLPVHLGLDTGMGRIGFQWSQKDELLAAAKQPELIADTLCSHFACADEADKSHAKEQLNRFIKFDEFLKSNGVNADYRHTANSAGIIDGHLIYTDPALPKFDFVREGIMLYGLTPSNEVDKTFPLKPALSWLATVSNVKEINPGDTVSYGASFRAHMKTIVATIPVGYADGYPRALSNKGKVIIGGKYARIIGRVCMDQFMVDVTDIPNVCTDSIATLVGTDGYCTITAEYMGDNAHSFNYEFVCGIAPRVPRIYVGV
ncbi:MAG: alanine racemase [Christensenellaceae bacterium]|jgi:alanine racemase|nr:alanine racemase [Christensenellaceae bacterium]